MVSPSITSRRERFHVATASQLCASTALSPRFSPVHWKPEARAEASSPPFSRYTSLQVITKSEPKETRLSSACSPLSNLEDASKSHIRNLEQNHQQQQQQQQQRWESQVHDHPECPLQIQHCTSACSSIPRSLFPESIFLSEIPLPVALSVFRSVKLPLDQIFKSVAICDPKISGFPIKSHTHDFDFSSCGLIVGRCHFLNLPHKFDGSRFGEEMISGPFLSVERMKAGTSGEPCYSHRCHRGSDCHPFNGDEVTGPLSFIIDIAQQVVHANESHNKNASKYFLASRVNVDGIFHKSATNKRQLDAILANYPGYKCCRYQRTSLSAVRPRVQNEDKKTHVKRSLSVPRTKTRHRSHKICHPYKNEACQGAMVTFKFLCLSRIIVELHKRFIILARTAATTASARSSLSSSSPTYLSKSSNTFATSDANDNIIKSRQTFLNYQIQYISSTLSSCTPSASSADLDANFSQSTTEEIENLMNKLSAGKGFVTFACWGVDAEKVLICGVRLGNMTENSDCNPESESSRAEELWVCFLVNGNLARNLQME